MTLVSIHVIALALEAPKTTKDNDVSDGSLLP